MDELLEAGRVFAGRYRIERFLAQGGFGAVYVAEQIETELRVALKVLWPHVLGSADAVEKFRVEARIASRVDSEHIVRVLDAGVDEPTRMPFLVMELLRGSELDRVVAEKGPLPAEDVVTYFRQIASALDKAHGYVTRDGAHQPIVHRDLKPENLFLTHRESGEPVVKILDFGIAKVLSESTKVSQEVKGTPLYMAFEQATAGRITPQTDVWALGLIAFFLLTGRCYWRAANQEEASLTQLFGEVLTLPIDAPSTRALEIGAPHVPDAGFDAWFARCVDRDPARRFSTAGECAAALAAALGVAVPSTPQNTPRSSSNPRTPAPAASAPAEVLGASAPVEAPAARAPAEVLAVSAPAEVLAVSAPAVFASTPSKGPSSVRSNDEATDLDTPGPAPRPRLVVVGVAAVVVIALGAAAYGYYRAPVPEPPSEASPSKPALEIKMPKRVREGEVLRIAIGAPRRLYVVAIDLEPDSEGKVLLPSARLQEPVVPAGGELELEPQRSVLGASGGLTRGRVVAFGFANVEDFRRLRPRDSENARPYLARLRKDIEQLEPSSFARREVDYEIAPR